MALHHDIFWVGKQWAVTGFGMQACDQKQKGKFDIEVARLWEDDELDRVRGQKWLNVEDFEAALAIARTRYPGAAPKAAPPASASRRRAIAPAEPLKPVEPPKPVAPKFHLRILGVRAKFLPQWRVRVRR
jgi:hypothetical protein